VSVAGRLEADTVALSRFTNSKEPPKRAVRPLASASVVVGFGDASGLGFGYNQIETGASDVAYFFGTWSEFVSLKPSNFRVMIERGTQIFIFTDNFVTERAFYRGTFKSPDLCALVLRLRVLEMTGFIFLRLIWVAGTRMIAQGADGLSRGDLSNGVIVGESMLDFVPIDKPALPKLHLTPMAD
jgi:hypothetical protein